MTAPARFAYTLRSVIGGEAGYAPLLPLTLEKEGHSISVDGLLDSGASVNVLPYSVGLKLGLNWDAQTNSIQLSGNLAATPTRIVLLQASVSDFPAVRLAFAWTQTDQVPIILGQVNFFAEFDVCFFRSQLAFDVTPRTAPVPPTVL